MRRLALYSLAGALVTWLPGCGSSPHGVEEKYVLVAANTKVPYWQNAATGLLRAAGQLQVKAEMVGPETYDANAEHTAFQDALQEKIKPTGILVSAADPNVMKPDIDAAIGQGIPVITMDADSRTASACSSSVRTTTKPAPWARRKR